MRHGKIFFLFGCVGLFSCLADDAWEGWQKTPQSAKQAGAVTIQRLVQREDRVQIVGPSIGFSERKDLYNHLRFSLAARYHFTEYHGWEVVRANFDHFTDSDVATDIRAHTSYFPDSQQANWSLSTSYILTPMYGKFSWGEFLLVHFDLFFLFGGGIRFAATPQPYGELGVGITHYFGGHFALVPQFRWRMYSETRATGTPLVSEVLVEMGLSVLL
jgi:outer membrane beta-barrel protein